MKNAQRPVFVRVCRSQEVFGVHRSTVSAGRSAAGSGFTSAATCLWSAWPMSRPCSRMHRKTIVGPDVGLWADTTSLPNDFKGNWCPGEDSNLHVHTDTST